MNKTILATTAAILATLSFASVSEAGWRHHNGFGHFNVVIDAPRYVADDYGYDDEPDCYWVKKQKINRYGELVIKKVQVCE